LLFFLLTISVILASKRLLAAMTSTATHTSNSQRPRINSSMFPMTYSKALSLWWGSDRNSATEAQKDVLSFLPFFPETDGKRVASVNMVHLSGRNRAINELEIIRKDEPVERTLVMLHGYGAGLALFYRYVSHYFYGTRLTE
jgi:cardiolipin-specific phospholipase